MKHVRSLLTAALVCGCLNSPPARAVDYEGEMPHDAHHLKIGDPALDFSLKGVDDKLHSLGEFKKAKVLMVVFLSNHCPYSHVAEMRLIPAVTALQDEGLAVVAINPNNPDALEISELGFSKYTDSFADMKRYAKDEGFPFPYLYDGDTQQTARAYGCLCTPHVFIFDSNRRLRYSGRWDDSRFADPSTVHATEALDAIQALLADKPVPVETTKVMGCSTKWLGKKAVVAQHNEQWNNEPVALDTIDAAGVAALAKNPTKKLRLFNVWSTTCIPCIQEFPDLVSLSRRLVERDFEMITISVDDPKDLARVKAFLQKNHAATPARVQKALKAEGRVANNYVFTGANVDELFKALDPSAPGPIPYTVVIAPGGKVVFRHDGAVNPDELKALLIDRLKPYYSPGIN
jgi:peroxiredoxin